MGHKLLIEFEIGLSSPLVKFLKPNEMLRGEQTNVTLYVTNIADRTFPGGKVTEYNIKYGPALNISSTTSTAGMECPELAPGRKTKLLSVPLEPVTDGLAWIQCKIEPNGDDKIVTYYQDPKDTPLDGAMWMNCAYVVNREQLVLAAALEELTSTIKLRGITT